jgi:diguanylate cyclase (GGDEF)-like protein/PAS domain S-box-containing protein
MDVAGSNRVLSPVGTGHCEAEVRRELDIWVAARLERVLPALAAIYVAISVVRFILERHQGIAIVNWLAFTTGLASLAVWRLLRRGRIPSELVPLSALLIGSLILVCSLAEFYRTSDTIQVAIILLVLIGGGTLVLAWWEFASLAALSVVGWVAIAPQRLALPSLICWSLALVTAVVFSGLGISRRLAKHNEAESARREEEARKLEEQINRERFELAFQGTEDGLWYWDINSDVFEFSPSWAAMLGYEPGELETNVEVWFSRVHPGYLTALRSQITSHLYGEGSEQFQNEHRLLRRDGTYLWVLARGRAIRNGSGEPVGLAGSHADITSLIEVEKRFLKDSFYDKLTNLPNRDFLMGCLEKKIEQQNQNRNQAPQFAVMFLDLDGFKIINDSLGHPVGDQLLAAVARTLRSCARPQDVVARFGGDEFVILLDRIRDREEALSIGNRIRGALSTPLQIGDREVVSGASVGIVLGSAEIDNTGDLLRYADIAMYHAKSNGKGQVQIFNDGMRSYATKLCDLQSDLRQALARDQLMFHYQPSFSVSSGKILGLEALIRLRRSEHEGVVTLYFIQLADETGLIREIGEWALRSACAQNAAWQRAGIPPVRMAVNISARQLQHRDFPETVLRILEETRLQSKWLELELTETALMDSLDLAPATLERLSALGIRIAIDDFGTGYSSWNYLRQFNFHTLKMDRCFVSDIATNGKAAAVAKGLITLAHNLDLSVIAEGVEQNAQLAFLAANGCDQAQGFLAGRPVSPEKLVNLLRLGDVKGAFQYDGFEPGAELRRLAYHASGSGIDLGSGMEPGVSSTLVVR